MDGWVRSVERVSWVVLVCAALMAPWLGLEPPLDGALGVGAIGMDVFVTAMMGAATVSQVVRIVQAPDGEHPVVRSAAWLLLLALCLICARMSWALAVVGDIRMTVTVALALICLAASVLLHAAGRVIYGSGTRAHDA